MLIILIGFDNAMPGNGMNDGTRARHASPLRGTVDNCSDCRGDACVALVNYGTPVNGNTPGTETDDAIPRTGMDDGTRARHASPLRGPAIIAPIVGATHASPW
jgi:hypothetical protein